MRDLAFTALMIGLLGVAAGRPFVGVLLWSWISFMNVHQLSWGFASSQPWAAVVFVVTVFGCFVAREPKRLPVNTLTILIAMFMAGITLTSLVALVPGEAVWSKWDRVFKIMLGVLLTAALLDSRRRVHAMIWLIVVSLGYFGVKGGIFTLTTGGGHIVMGPPNSMIGDRNHMATALLVSLPLMNYLRLQSRHRPVQMGLVFAMATTLFSVVGSQSRGALVGLVATAAMLWLRSRGKLLSGVAIAVGVGLAITFMPETWTGRMNTILTYQEDGSAMGRVTIWLASLHIALMRPLFGGGFRAMYQQEIVNQAMPGVAARAAHSIWFEVLGEHGFVVFAIWLGMLVTGGIYTLRLARRTRNRPDLRWAYDLARMTQVSMAAYASAGSFVSLSYWDCFWTLMVTIGAAYRLVDEAIRAAPVATPPLATMGWRQRALVTDAPPLVPARTGLRP
jgi:probable O-glycosylation ligase (exosortase A-associated)